MVPIGERALAWLDRYLEDLRPQLLMHADERALFVAAEGVRFTPDGLGNRVAKIIQQSGCVRATGRVTCFARRWRRRGSRTADVLYLQEILGHARLDTVQIHNKVSIEKLK